MSTLNMPALTLNEVVLYAQLLAATSAFSFFFFRLSLLLYRLTKRKRISTKEEMNTSIMSNIKDLMIEYCYVRGKTKEDLLRHNAPQIKIWFEEFLLFIQIWFIGFTKITIFTNITKIGNLLIDIGKANFPKRKNRRPRDKLKK